MRFRYRLHQSAAGLGFVAVSQKFRKQTIAMNPSSDVIPTEPERLRARIRNYEQLIQEAWKEYDAGSDGSAF